VKLELQLPLPPSSSHHHHPFPPNAQAASYILAAYPQHCDALAVANSLFRSLSLSGGAVVTATSSSAANLAALQGGRAAVVTPLVVPLGGSSCGPAGCC
jgi:hypothetical protein